MIQERNKHKGIFITLEGPEGSGKTTIANLVAKELEAKGHHVVLTREPGGIEISEKIREIILHPIHTKMDGKTEALLYAAARRQHLAERVIPGLEEGKIIICDRFVDSSLAYQGYARGLGIEQVLKINEFAIDGYMPDLTIYFDLDYKIGLQRIHKDDEREKNRLDMEKDSFHKKVNEGYQVVKELFNDRIHTVDANQSVEEVKQQCMQILESKLSL